MERDKKELLQHKGAVLLWQMKDMVMLKLHLFKGTSSYEKLKITLIFSSIVLVIIGFIYALQ